MGVISHTLQGCRRQEQSPNLCVPLTPLGGVTVTSLFHQEMRNESGYFNSWSRQTTKEHHSGVKVRPRFTHQKAARELHVGDSTLRLSQALLRTVKTLRSCKPMRYFCFTILLERAEYSSDIFQFAEQAGKRQGAGETREIEVFQEPDTSKNMTTCDGESWQSCHSASVTLEMAPHCLR